MTDANTTQFPAPIELPTMPSITVAPVDEAAWDEAAVWDDGEAPEARPAPTQPEPAESVQERAIRALVEAQEREELFAEELHALEARCMELQVQRNSLQEERDELQATVDELLTRAQQTVPASPVPVPGLVVEHVSPSVAAIPPPVEALPTPWFPHPPAAAKPAPRRVTVSAFKRAFGDRRLSLFADELPDALDVRAASQIRRSRIPVGVVAGLLAIVGFLAFSYQWAAEDLDARHSALMEKYGQQESPVETAPPAEEQLATATPEPQHAPPAKRRRRGRRRR